MRFGIVYSPYFAARLLPTHRLDAGDVAADLAHARGVLELARRPLEAQVELLLLQLDELVVELVVGHAAQIVLSLHGGHPSLLADARDEARLDRQLGRAKRERLARRSGAARRRSRTGCGRA
jgi:hypothetical protein